MPGEFLVNPICQCPGQMSCPSVAPKNVEVMVYDKKVCCMIIEYMQGHPWQSAIISTKFEYVLVSLKVVLWLPKVPKTIVFMPLQPVFMKYYFYAL